MRVLGTAHPTVSMLALVLAACDAAPSRPSPGSDGFSSDAVVRVDLRRGGDLRADAAAADRAAADTAKLDGARGAALCPDPLPGNWIFCDDFESDNVPARYFELGADDGDFQRVSTESSSGSHSMEVVFQAGEVEAGGLKVTFGRNPIGSRYRSSEDFTDIYWRMYLKNQVGWSGSPAKLSRATVFAASNWGQAMIAHLWSAGDVLLGDPASCVDGSSVKCTTYNDFANLDWLGQLPGKTKIFATSESGVWRCVEGRARLNDPGQSNGVFEFWIDGQLENARYDLDWRGSYTEYGINAVFFENYWNDGSPVLQKRWFDDLVIATARIGCF
jgi:hypothetical protein